MSKSYRDIYEEKEWTRAFSMIMALDVSSRRKSTIKYTWKKKNKQADTTIPPEKDKAIWNKRGRDTHADLIKRISALEDDFKTLKSGVNLSTREYIHGRCSLCGKDPEGYDLPCTHEICHACFKSRLIETNITCTVCKKTFHYDYLLE